jgi:D-amino peptidase
MKVYISADMEGISGVVSRTQIKPFDDDYKRARVLLTNEVNAAIEGALKAGAKGITVNDGHGNGTMTNILIESLNTNAQLISGGPRKLGMMEGIDSTFDAAIFIGYPSRMNTPGVLSTSFDSSVISNINLNGKDAGEFYMNALAAGYYNVPVVFVSGDNILANEARNESGKIKTTIVKIAHGRYAAKCISPTIVQGMIKEKVEEALRSVGVIKSVKVSGKIELKVTFLNSGLAEIVSFIPGFELVHPNVVQYNTNDFIESYRALMSMIEIAKSV